MSMDITLLTEEQIWGDNALQVMKDYGTKTGMSDLAIVLGGLMGKGAKTSDNQLAGYVWSASSNVGGLVRTVSDDGGRDSNGPHYRRLGARPALPSSVASSIKPSEARLTRKIGDIQVVEYGEYPQTIAPENVTKELNGLSEVQLKKMETGKKYIFDGEKHDAYDKPFSANEHVEYQHKGKRYIRVEAKPYDSDSVLSTGHKPETGESCWIEVQPIEWLKDPSGVWVARQALFAGVQFDKKQRYNGDFENTDMNQYLQNHFAKEMQAGRNVGTPAALGPNTAAVTARRDTQRQRALDDPSQGL